MPLGKLQTEADLKRWLERLLASPDFRTRVRNGDTPPTPDLDAIEALTGTGLATRTATDTWALRSLAGGRGIGVTNPAGTAGNPSVAVNTGLVVANLKIDYGAVGDGNRTAGTGTDDLAALNAAIADLNSGAINALFIPDGDDCYILSAVPDTITASDYAIFGAGMSATVLRMKSTAAHGTFFTLGASGGTASSRGTISNLTVWCNETSNTPPASERAFHLVKGGTTFISDIGCQNIGGLCKVGTTTAGDRFQLYGFLGVYGNWNSETPAPSRIHIINGTDGRFVNVRLTQNEVNGGYGIHADPTSVGCDLHVFDNCAIWGMGAYSENSPAADTHDGIDRNVYINFTDGQVVNWIFKGCVFDESRLQGAYIFSNSGNEVCRDIYFIGCHWATGAGRGVYVNHNGTGRCQNIEVIGGRIRYKDAPAIQLSGADVDNFLAQGVSLQHDTFRFFSTSAAGNTFSTDDGTTARFKHGLAVNDQLKFTISTVTSTGNLTDAGDVVYVKSVADAYTFTLSDTLGGSTIDVTNNGTGTLIHHVECAFQQDDSNGVRIQGCFIGPFYTVTDTDYAVKNLAGSTSDRYAIVGNVSTDMNTGFDTGYASSASKVVANNAAG